MSKFRIGDRVRLVKFDKPVDRSLYDLIGEVGIVTQNSGLDATDVAAAFEEFGELAFYETELEPADEDHTDLLRHLEGEMTKVLKSGALPNFVRRAIHRWRDFVRESINENGD